MSAPKKFTSAQCLDEIIRRVNETPSLIRDHIRIFTDEQNHELVNVLWPAVFDHSNWYRTSTRRPGKEKEDPANPGSVMGFGSGYSGTDKEVRVYENEAWSDSGRGLEVTVITEYGEFAEVLFNVNW
jgi:hypothetical protein